MQQAVNVFNMCICSFARPGCLKFTTLNVASRITIVGEKLISPYTLCTTAERMTPCNTRANRVELCCALGGEALIGSALFHFLIVSPMQLNIFWWSSSHPPPHHPYFSATGTLYPPSFFSPSILLLSPPSVSLHLSDSISELQPPVREWVISSKLIWPLMIGSGTYSSVSDWPRDEEANFPWCSWRIVVALNYHLPCVYVCVCVAWEHVLRLHACASVFINVWECGRSWQLVDWQ